MLVQGPADAEPELCAFEKRLANACSSERGSEDSVAQRLRGFVCIGVLFARWHTSRCPPHLADDLKHGARAVAARLRRAVEITCGTPATRTQLQRDSGHSARARREGIVSKGLSFGVQQSICERDTLGASSVP